VQRSFDGPTKSDRVRYVPILDPLLPVLRAWKLRHPGRLVFTNQAGAMFAPSGPIFQEVLHRVLAAAELPKVKRNEHNPPARMRDAAPSRLRSCAIDFWYTTGIDLLAHVLGVWMSA
jgi:hypothetical protein